MLLLAIALVKFCGAYWNALFGGKANLCEVCSAIAMIFATNVNAHHVVRCFASCRYVLKEGQNINGAYYLVEMVRASAC